MLQRTEVLTLLAHLIVTISLIALYGMTIILDKPEPTLQNALLIAIGFWFGAAGGVKVKDAISKRKDGEAP